MGHNVIINDNDIIIVTSELMIPTMIPFPTIICIPVLVPFIPTWSLCDTYAHTHAHTYTHMHTHMHTRTHTHTHTRVLSDLYLSGCYLLSLVAVGHSPLPDVRGIYTNHMSH